MGALYHFSRHSRFVARIEGESHLYSVDYQMSMSAPETATIYLLALENEPEVKIGEEYLMLFIHEGYATRRQMLNHILGNHRREDGDLTALSFKAFQDRYEISLFEMEMRLKSEGFYVNLFLNLSFGDYCIALPKDQEHELSRLAEIVERFIETRCRIYEYAQDSDERQFRADIAEKSHQVLCRLHAGNMLHLPNYELYKQFLYDMLVADQDDADKLAERSLLCAQIIRSLEAESFQLLGSHSKSSSLMVKDALFQSKRLLPCLRRFDKQASMPHAYYDFLWSVIFITRSMHNAVFDQMDLPKIPNRSRAFTGFLPVVSDDYQEISSYFSSHNRSVDAFGLLFFPEFRHPFNLFEHLPAFIHEFFHYIPPINRSERNSMIVSMALHSVLQPLRLCLDSADYMMLFRRIDDALISMINASDAWLYLRSEQENKQYVYETVNEPCRSVYASGVLCSALESYDDSMFFLEKLYDMLYHWDFRELLSEEVGRLSNLSVRHVVDAEMQARLAERWERYQNSFFRTYTIALREIRSDIFMTSVLKLTCRDYIELLLEEPNFASSDVSWVADSSILRFGFMASYLNKNETPLAVIDDIRASLDAKDAKHARLHNLKQYWCQYLEKGKNKNMNDPDSYFIFDALMQTAFIKKEKGSFAISSVQRPMSLISSWEWEIGAYEKEPFFKQLQSLYRFYQDLKNSKTEGERIRFLYKTRIVFRDYFTSFSDILIKR